MLGRYAIDRLLTFVFGVLLALAGAVVLLVTSNAVKTSTLSPSGWFREQFVRLDELTGTDETIALAAGAAALAIGVIIALPQLVPSRRPRRERELAVRDASGNTVSLACDSVNMVAEQAAHEVPGVYNARMDVVDGSDGTVVNGDVTFLDDVNVSEKTREVTQRIQAALEGRLGIKVQRTAMKIRLTSAAGTERGRRHGEPYPYRHEGAGTTR
jgi:hypothetical protein